MSGAKSPASSTSASPYLIFVLSHRLAMRAKPPLGGWQPQGLIEPTASAVERTVSTLPADLAPAGAGPSAPRPATTTVAARKLRKRLVTALLLSNANGPGAGARAGAASRDAASVR